jgi:hypothetical protein
MLRSDQLKVGDRVVLPDGYETFPLFSIANRLSGAVVDLDQKGFVFVRLDQHVPELAEWDNVLHVYVDCPGDDLEGEVPSLERE